MISTRSYNFEYSVALHDSQDFEQKQSKNRTCNEGSNDNHPDQVSLSGSEAFHHTNSGGDEI